MGYYRGYRSWWSTPTKYDELGKLFGKTVLKIKDAFLNLDEDSLNELFSLYGGAHGKSAEQYARKTFGKWKSGETKLSGMTMERLIELVPLHLSPEQRIEILDELVEHHKPRKSRKHIEINIKEPHLGFYQISEALKSMEQNDLLASLPENVMKAAKWLYADDITALRSVLADKDRIENEIIKSNAQREIQILKNAIHSGQVRAANYSVELPSGILDISAYTPSIFESTASFIKKLF